VQVPASGARWHGNWQRRRPPRLSDVNAQGLAETLASLPAVTEARGYAVDVSNRQAVFAHADDVRRDFGTAHFVVNNAGATMVAPSST